MEIALTFDVELWTWRGDIAMDVERPLDELIRFSEQHHVPITLFVALSNKGLGSLSSEEYRARMFELLARHASNPLVEFGVHAHCLGLPVGFDTPADEIDAYSMSQAEEIIRWSVDIMQTATGRVPQAFRAANFALPRRNLADFGTMLSRQGIIVDSSDLEVIHSRPARMGGVWEIPPATDPILGPRHKVWSPDTMPVDEMTRFAEEAAAHTQLLVMNAHSFLFEDAGIYRPDSPALQLWFSLPPALQSVARPMLALAKRAASRRATQAPASVGTSVSRAPALRTLVTVVEWLRDADCEFTTLTSCVERLCADVA